MSEKLPDEAQRLIEVLIGPCTRSAADQRAEEIQSLLDDLWKDLGPSVAVNYVVAVDPPA